MTKIIVDTNIVFSALLNTNSRIGQILISGKNHFDFYSPAYVRFEIFKHKEKIKSIIPTEIYKNAELLCQDIDIDDTIFVAVSNFTTGILWTGDLKLLNGLIKKGYKNLIKTDELYQLFLEKERI